MVERRGFMTGWVVVRFGLVAALGCGGLAHAQGNSVVYRCPGNIYTDSISAKEAQEKSCRTLEGAPVTVIQSVKPRSEAKPVPPRGASGATEGRPDARIDPNDQRSRDNDARRILEAELKAESERLAALQREFNNGEPERRGEERNYQKYQDRVAELKAGIARKESDIAALKRELAKLPQ
jgi:predicted RNase H-like nuclease (RuvC/YqgF family)